MKKILMMMMVVAITFLTIVESSYSLRVIRVTENGRENGGGSDDTYLYYNEKTEGNTKTITCFEPGSTNCPVKLTGAPAGGPDEMAMTHAKNQIISGNLIGVVFLPTPIERNVSWNKNATTNKTIIKVWGTSETEPVYP